eukprot:339351-Pyramimonas_sp.AAC.1
MPWWAPAEVVSPGGPRPKPARACVRGQMQHRLADLELSVHTHQLAPETGLVGAVLLIGGVEVGLALLDKMGAGCLGSGCAAVA